MKDTIYRADAIEAVRKIVPVETEIDSTLLDKAEVIVELFALPSAEAKRVLQGYCKGADCRWWNPQVEGCNRCVFVKAEYTYPSAETTCATCADRAMCIMSEPDGNWKACKDYRAEKPYYDEDDYWAGRQAEAVPHGRLIDADALSEKLCETTIFIKDGEVFQRMINDAPTVSAETASDAYKRGFEDAKRAYEVELARSGDAVKAVQDCRNCKYGSYNDHLDTWFCNHNCECSNWDLWESAEAVQGEWRIGKPSKSGTYLVTVDSMRHGMVDIFHYGKPMLPNIAVKGMCWYRSDDEWGDVVYDDKDIFAWMPLPEPYKGGDDE